MNHHGEGIQKLKKTKIAPKMQTKHYLLLMFIKNITSKRNLFDTDNIRASVTNSISAAPTLQINCKGIYD